MNASSSSDRGAALFTVCVFIAVAALLLAGLAARATQQAHQIDHYRAFEDCMPSLDAAIARSIFDLESGGNGWIGLGNWSPSSTKGKLDLPTFNDPVEPMSLSGTPSVEYMAFAKDWASDGFDNNGDGATDDGRESGVYTIYAFAKARGVRRAAQVVVQGSDINVWRNALFAGDGNKNGLVTGNVTVAGSVHLLGDELLDGAVAISLTGSGEIKNNYGGMPAAFTKRIPGLEYEEHDGEKVQTLGAKLRVKRGRVGISGGATIGTKNVGNNKVKETLDATFVADGWTGTSVASDGDRGDPKNVFSDNGWDAPYDMGDGLKFPLLSDPYHEMASGETFIDSSTGKAYSTFDYWKAALTPEIYKGDMTITTEKDFYWNAQRPSESFEEAANRKPGEDYIYFNAKTNIMEVSGQIMIDGDLYLGKEKKQDKTLYFTGRAAILVNGNVDIDTNLYSQNADGSQSGSFPVANCLGIMAGKDIVVGRTANQYVMGAFYAQGKFESLKKTHIAGSVVANYFDFGKSSPLIYEVPTLADNLPEGMLGVSNGSSLTQLAWREIGA
ncbi:MAG TPA: hypothetical protein PLJ47_00165 [Candidatus Hydrogenedentes bacterium]|nr:hypothetical protein [Candidatus Hydrogenedentota bacterium]HRK32976.1 hypothetical protein [Candidatus Hydrogenedentota bacterium]